MVATDLREFSNEHAAKRALVTWHLGYPPGNCHRNDDGGWVEYPPAMPFKHLQVVNMAALIARYGADVFHNEDRVERGWAVELAPEECIIEPDHICAYMGLTMPLEHEVSEDEWGEKAFAARSLYIQWADELWGNTTVKAMLERLRDEFAQRDVFLGEDIAHMLEDMRASLGPGAVDAPE